VNDRKRIDSSKGRRLRRR